MTTFLFPKDKCYFDAPTEEDEREHWNGVGHVTFFVIQNVPDTFEVEILDHSGCAGGLDETIGLEYYITDAWDLQGQVREGGTYTLNKLTVTWTRGDGWSTDDDVEYEFESITAQTTAVGYLLHKVKMIWWRQVQCRLRDWKKS